MRWKWGKRLKSLSDSSEKAVVLDNKKLAGKINNNNNNNNVVSLIFLMAVIFKTLKHNTPSAEFLEFFKNNFFAGTEWMEPAATLAMENLNDGLTQHATTQISR